MLVLSRKQGEKIIIDDRITITLVRVDHNQVRLGIEAPRSVSVVREELLAPREQPTALASAISPKRAPLAAHLVS
jgi:carbon storage regulator